MSIRALYMMVTVTLSIGVYYLWSVVWQRNENIAILLGVLTAILVSGFFGRLKKR
ncbi:MAG: hypothetical protein ACOY31_01395 [Bacillota bacterium]